MMDMETLVGRLMDLETKYYDLQDKYHQLINQYEKLKDEHEGCSKQAGTKYDPWSTKT